MNLMTPFAQIGSFGIGQPAAIGSAAFGYTFASQHTSRTTSRSGRDANTFGGIAAEWIANNEREGKAAMTLERMRWLLGKPTPLIGDRPISQISPQDVFAVLRKIEMDGHYESARRMRSVVSHHV